MPILGQGLDLVDVARIAAMLVRHQQTFLDRVYTPLEQAYCQQQTRRIHERLAGRFAAKEAVLKALGTGWRNGIAWTDMEILPNEAGRPVLTLSGRCAELAREKGIVRWHVSITHTDSMAAAAAIAEGD